MRKLSGFLVLVFAVAFLMGGTALGAETIKIGMVQPLTGPVSFGGNTLLNGARLAVEKINAAGGVLGRKLELVPPKEMSRPASRSP